MEIKELKTAIINESRVMHNGIEYIPREIICRVDRKKCAWVYSAGLRDIKANCVVVADINQVELKNKEKAT